MPLASFGWTPISDTQMLIVGGSDGEMLQEGCWIVDFKEGEAKMQANSMETQTAMSKVVYRKTANTVYNIGGFDSGGINFQSQLGSGWEEFPRSHLQLNLRNENEIELANSASVYFK